MTFHDSTQFIHLAFSLLTEGSLGITEALCCKINTSVKLLSWITPKECNDSVSEMLTTAELRSFRGSTTKKNAWCSFQGSGWQHLQLLPFSLLSPYCHYWRVQIQQLLKEISFTLLSSHVQNVKNNEAAIYYIFILLTAGQTRTAGGSFTC